jgi:hypothetical protein
MLARYRETFVFSGTKSDLTDADLILRQKPPHLVIVSAYQSSLYGVHGGQCGHLLQG